MARATEWPPGELVLSLSPPKTGCATSDTPLRLSGGSVCEMRESNQNGYHQPAGLLMTVIWPMHG